jgi:hypothetical protein
MVEILKEKRRVGRLGRKWLDNIKWGIGVDWTQLARDKARGGLLRTRQWTIGLHSAMSVMTGRALLSCWLLKQDPPPEPDNYSQDNNCREITYLLTVCRNCVFCSSLHVLLSWFLLTESCLSFIFTLPPSFFRPSLLSPVVNTVYFLPVRQLLIMTFLSRK